MVKQARPQAHPYIDCWKVGPGPGRGGPTCLRHLYTTHPARAAACAALEPLPAGLAAADTRLDGRIRWHCPQTVRSRLVASRAEEVMFMAEALFNE